MPIRSLTAPASATPGIDPRAPACAIIPGAVIAPGANHSRERCAHDESMDEGANE